jgi:hypothetical protein
MPPIYALHDMDLSNYAIIFSEITINISRVICGRQSIMIKTYSSFVSLAKGYFKKPFNKVSSYQVIV